MKKLLALLLTLSLCLGMAAVAAAESGEQITLTFEHQDTEKPERIKYYEDVAAAYHELHPNVTIEVTGISFTDAQTSILTQISGGTPFDMFQYFVGDTKIWLDKNALLPLTDYFTANDNALLNIYLDGIDSMITFGDGNIYGVPEYISTAPINYNKEIFEQDGIASFPTTKDEFFALCDRFKAEGYIPFQLHGSMVDDLVVVLALQFEAKYGVDPYAVIQGEVPFTDPWYVDTISLLKEMYDRGYLPESFWTIGGTEGRMAYSTGEMPMKFGYFWDVDTHFEMGMPYEIQAVASFPNLTGADVTPYVYASACVFGVSPACAYPDVAMDFLTFLTNADNQAAMAFEYFGNEINGMPMANKAVNLSTYAQAYNDTITAGIGTPWACTNVSLQYMDVFGTNIPLLMEGEITVEEFCAAIDALR